MSAPGAEAAQSDAGTAPDGQGQDQDRSAQQYSVLGEDAFSDAPEEMRDHLINYVRSNIDPQLTQRFQEAAQFKQTWEPFSQIEGLTDLHPDDVDQLVELGYTIAAASDGNEQAVEALRETWEQLGEQFGFAGEEGDGEEDEETGDEPQYMTREEYEAERAREQQQSQHQETVQQTAQEIRGFVEKLALPGEPGSEKREKAEKALYAFMSNYAEDPNLSNEQLVQAAFADYGEIVGGAQEQLVEENEDRQTGSTLKGGGADTSPEEVHGWAEADKLAKARLTGAR